MAAMLREHSTSLAASIVAALAGDAATPAQRRSARRAELLPASASPAADHGKLPGDIPYGMQRLLSVALAYGAGAEALLLDEPAAGLGGGDMKRLADVLVELRRRSVAVVRDRASHGPDHGDRRPHRHDRPGRDAGDGHAGRDPARRGRAAKPIWGAPNDRRARVRRALRSATAAMSRSSASTSRVPAGSMVGMVGANGAGKSTLVNALAGWSRGRADCDAARVRLGGEDIDGLPPHERVRRGLTLVPEGKDIFAELTVDENLGTGASAGGYRRPPLFSIHEVFELFPRLAERRAPQGRGMLSGGERQMLAVEPGAARRARACCCSTSLGRPGAAPGLRAAVTDPRAGRSRPAGAAGRAERARGAGGGGPALSAGARQGGRPRTGRHMEDDPRIVEAYLGTSLTA